MRTCRTELATLYYVADPMCSWCWGFAPEWAAIRERLPESVAVRYVMGGLAPDSDEPMPAEVREYVQGAWRSVEERTGARFDWRFWEVCEPRRSTYPACRACLAAESQGAGQEMFAALQRAYYLEARNPSDASTHVALAGELGLDAERFAADLVSPEVEESLRADFALRAELGVRSFPSLVQESDAGNRRLVLAGYERAETVLERLLQTGWNGSKVGE